MAKSNTRNGLIELFRFLCALWVAYFHGFSPITSDEFNGVIAPVDFFFMVTGLFFLQSIEKYRKKPFLDGARYIFWGKNKRIIVPLAIAAFSIFLCNLLVELDFSGFNWPLSFLWFFAAQFVYSAVFYLIYKKTKRIWVFNVICVAVICLSMTFFKLGIEALDIPARGPAMLALGILISQIPKIRIRLKDEIKGQRISMAINAIGFVASAIAAVYLAYLPGFSVWKLHLLCCVAFPALLYFADALPVHSKFLNFLGELSIFIYLAQCPILLHYYFVSRNTSDQFWLLCICAAALFVLNRIINKFSGKKIVRI